MRIIIIGGLSAGPSAAAKARRENESAEILLFEKTADISYATCGIPYALSGVIPSRDKLLVTDVEKLRKRFNIKVHLEEEVWDIDPEARTITTQLATYGYDKLIFTTGARAFVPNIQNLNVADNWATCRNLADFDKISSRALVPEVNHITIMGAGLIGIEVAENLRHMGKSVTIIEGGPNILPMWEPKFAGFAANVLKDKGVEIITNTFVKKVNTHKDKITSIELGPEQYIETDFLIMSVGIKPNTEILKSKGAITLPNGALQVNAFMETSLEGIYAAGDNAGISNLITKESDYMPLGTHSNKGGRAAGFNAGTGKHGVQLNGGYKTAIIKVFDHTLARTGLGPKDLLAAKIPFKRNLTVAGATPEYYPNQKDMIIETYYHAESHQLLGAELFGEFGVDKRVDVLSTAIYAGLKIEDLPQLDLAYAPPYAPAKDPVVVNGFVATNHLLGNYQEMSVEDLREHLLKNSDLQIVDLRTTAERMHDGIPSSLHIPLDELRVRMHELDPARPTVVYCQKGMRGYIGSRILKHHGFDHLSNLAGGMLVWNMYTREHQILSLTDELAV